MGIRVVLDDRGRLSIPSEIRKKLGFREGDSVVIEPSGPGEFRVIRLPEVASRTKGMYRHLLTPGRCISEELIADRRHEAKEDEPKDD